jgi:GntR family transcriptional regulator, rspAB operon transcriptional repressor
MPMPARNARRTTDAVFTHLHEAIVRGAVSAGERIDLDAVAAELDVSRTPIREALLRLESEGLVERIPYRGAVVAAVDPRVAADVAAVRIHLEGLAMRLAVPRLTDATLGAMADCLDDLDALQGKAGLDVRDRWNELNDRFHGLLYEAADCPQLMRPLESLSAQASRIRRHFDARQGPAQADHRAILLACRNRNADQAARAAQRHILRAYARMVGDEIDPGSPLGVSLELAGLRRAGP